MTADQVYESRLTAMSEISLAQNEQAQKLTEIGDYLRQVREQHNLTLEQMAGRTLIQARLLNAIESGNLKPLPEPVYIRGFIKRYSEALGLNGGEIAEAFPIESGLRTVQPSWKDSPAAQLRPLHLWAAYVLLIVAAVSGLSYVISQSSFNTVRPTQATTTDSTAPSPEASRPAVSPSSTVASAASPDASGLPVRVDMTLTGQSWVRVEVDGKNEFEGVLSEGTQRTFTANEAVKIRAGNAGGVLIAYNDSEAQLMGAPGAVKEMTFSLDQNSASLPNSSANPLPQ